MECRLNSRLGQPKWTFVVWFRLVKGTCGEGRTRSRGGDGT